MSDVLFQRVLFKACLVYLFHKINFTKETALIHKMLDNILVSTIYYDVPNKLTFELSPVFCKKNLCQKMVKYLVKRYFD